MVRGWLRLGTSSKFGNFWRHGRRRVFQSDRSIGATHLCRISTSAAISRNGATTIPLHSLEQRPARRVVCNVLSFAKNYFRNGCCAAFTLTRKPGCPFRARLYSPWSPNAGDWPTATLQATLAEQRTALLRHSATAPSETRTDHVIHRNTHDTKRFHFSCACSPAPMSVQKCSPVRNAPLHPSLAMVVF